jgi:hypothetical protein
MEKERASTSVSLAEPRADTNSVAFVVISLSLMEKKLRVVTVSGGL